MSAVMIATMMAAIGQASPPPTGGLDPRLMLAGDVDSTLSEFERLCLRNPFDRPAYEEAVGASSWRFRRVEVETENSSAHSAQRGYAYFRGPNSTGGGLQQCNLDAAVRQAPDPETLAARIEDRLEQRLGMSLRRRQAGPSLFWQWPVDTGWVVRLYLMRHSGADPRQLTLSLQRWPANLAGEPESSNEATQ